MITPVALLDRRLPQPGCYFSLTEKINNFVQESNRKHPFSMKKITLFSLLLCFVFTGNAQINITQQTTFGGSKSEWFQKMMKVGSSYYFAGTSNSDVSFDKAEPSRGMDDFWVIKTDTAFNIIWQRTIGGNRGDFLSSITHTADAGILLFGTSSSDSSGEKSANGFGHSDYWLVKLSDDGTILWDLTIGGSNSDFGYTVLELKDGSLLLGGCSNSDSSGLRTQFLRGLRDFWLVKIDQQGAVIWNRAYGGNGVDWFGDMALYHDTLLIMTGISDSPASYEKSSNGYGDWDIWVVCVNLDGDLVWETTLGGNGDDRGIPIVFGNYIYIIGSSDSDISGTKTENSKGGYDFWINKLDIAGNIIWDRTIGGTNNDAASAAVVSSNGRIVMAGASASGISGDKTEPNRGWGDYWVVAIDTNGVVLWDKTFGGSMPDVSRSIIETFPGRFIVAGTSESGFSGDKTFSLKGEREFWVVEFDITTGVTKHHSLNAGMDIYPNPASSIVHFELEESTEKISSIALYDIHGRQVAEWHPQNHTAALDISHLSGGIYLARATVGQKVITRKVVVR